MLEILKQEVCAAAKRGQRDGLCKHRSGNFSARDKETGYMVTTPSAVDRETLTPRDMIVVDKDASVIENLSGFKPSSETLMHLKIYETRADVHAIAHTHSMYATTFAILNKPIPAIVYEAAAMGLSKGRIPVAPYGRPGTPDLANSVIEAVKEADCFLMKGHGSCAVDAGNIYEAYLKASYIEEIAQLYYNSLTANAGKEPEYFPAAELQQWEYPKEIKL